MSPETLIELSRPATEEQSAVQGHKQTYRSKDVYNELLYPYGFEMPSTYNGSQTTAEGKIYFPSPTVRSVLHIVARDLAVGSEIRPLRWLDVGGGLGRAQSEYSMFNQQSTRRLTLATTNQDVVVDHATDDLHPRLLTILDILKPFQPEVFPVDICLAAPEIKSHYITSVFSIPYWSNPLQGIVNMYNNLETGGVMSIATDSLVAWSSLIRYAKSIHKPRSPIDDLISTLDENGIASSFATTTTSLITDKRALKGDVAALTIHKTHPAELALTSDLERTVTIPASVSELGSHKVAYYTPQENSSPFTFR
jgi:hypothetical protein